VEWIDVPFTEIGVLGYELWMDSGSDGYFKQKLDGRNKPGVMSYLASDLETGRAYKFMVRAINFNGFGDYSTEATFYSCLPP
jgi:hypothetical protein